ncbi:membrane protein [Lentzea sp. NBRC 105346]|nr:membrane protein [Lentzea sp. NBRC 105346]
MLAVGSALGALALVVFPGVWRVSRYAVTVAHEGGHALMAVVTGQRLEKITMHAFTGGATHIKNPSPGLRWFVTALAGYPAPPLLGLGAAHLVVRDQVRPMLMLCIGLLAVTFLHSRGWFAPLVVVVIGGLVYLATWRVSQQTREAIGYGIAWFLLIGGLRAVSVLHSLHRSKQGKGSDATELKELTAVSARFWVFLFYVVAIGALYLGGRVLLHL